MRVWLPPLNTQKAKAWPAIVKQPNSIPSGWVMARITRGATARGTHYSAKFPPECRWLHRDFVRCLCCGCIW